MRRCLSSPLSFVRRMAPCCWLRRQRKKHFSNGRPKSENIENESFAGLTRTFLTTMRSGLSAFRGAKASAVWVLE